MNTAEATLTAGRGFRFWARSRLTWKYAEPPRGRRASAAPVIRASVASLRARSGAGQIGLPRLLRAEMWPCFARRSRARRDRTDSPEVSAGKGVAGAGLEVPLEDGRAGSGSEGGVGDEVPGVKVGCVRNFAAIVVAKAAFEVIGDADVAVRRGGRGFEEVDVAHGEKPSATNGGGKLP